MFNFNCGPKLRKPELRIIYILNEVRFLQETVNLEENLRPSLRETFENFEIVKKLELCGNLRQLSNN